MNPRFNYNIVSKDYDSTRFTGRKNRYNNMIYNNTLKSLLPKDRSIQVLDVGCGTGRGSIFLGRLGYNVLGIDYTHEMLKFAIEKRSKEKMNNVKFGRCEALNISLMDESVDCVVSLNFLHLFPLTEQTLFLKEMLRVLKPGGCLIIEFDNYYGGFISGMRVARKYPELKLNKPWEYSKLFDSLMIEHELTIQEYSGNSLPFLWRLFQYFPKFGAIIEKASYLYPICFLSRRILIRALKDK